MSTISWNSSNKNLSPEPKSLYKNFEQSSTASKSSTKKQTSSQWKTKPKHIPEWNVALYNPDNEILMLWSENQLLLKELFNFKT